MIEIMGLDITWLGHDGYLLEEKGVRIFIDPFKLSDEAGKPASLVLITHEHFDHCSIEDLRRIVTGRTVIVAPNECMSILSKLEPAEVVLIAPGETKNVLGLSLTAIAAYNTNKYRDPATKTPFHPKEDGKLGYLIDFGSVKLYHAGDTDNIPEMEAVECDIALLPVSGTYVMTAHEAAEAARRIKPKIAIPMHYGSIVGSKDDAVSFKRLLDGSAIDVRILEKENQ